MTEESTLHQYHKKLNEETRSLIELQTGMENMLTRMYALVVWQDETILSTVNTHREAYLDLQSRIETKKREVHTLLNKSF